MRKAAEQLLLKCEQILRMFYKKAYNYGLKLAYYAFA